MIKLREIRVAGSELMHCALSPKMAEVEGAAIFVLTFVSAV